MKDGSTVRFGDTISLALRDDIDELGSWNEASGEISIRKEQSEAGKHVVLVHELLHVAETLLKSAGVIKRRANHEFITNAAPIVLAGLVDFGVIRGVSKEDLDEFVEQQTTGDELELPEDEVKAVLDEMAEVRKDHQKEMDQMANVSDPPK